MNRFAVSVAIALVGFLCILITTGVSVDAKNVSHQTKPCTGFSFEVAGMLSKNLLLVDNSTNVYDLPLANLNTNMKRLFMEGGKPIVPFATKYPAIIRHHLDHPTRYLEPLVTFRADHHTEFIIFRFFDLVRFWTYLHAHQVGSDNSTKQAHVFFPSQAAVKASKHFISSAELQTMYTINFKGGLTVLSKYQSDGYSAHASAHGYIFKQVDFAICQGRGLKIYVAALPIRLSCKPVSFELGKRSTGFTDGETFYLFGEHFVYIFRNFPAESTLFKIPNDKFFVCGKSIESSSSAVSINMALLASMFVLGTIMFN